MNQEALTHHPPFARKNNHCRWLLDVWVQPGAKKTALAGEYQGCVKIRVSAPAVDNKANKVLVSFIAETLGLKKKQIHMESGQTNRRKVLSVDSVVEPEWERLVPAGVE